MGTVIHNWIVRNWTSWFQHFLLLIVKGLPVYEAIWSENAFPRRACVLWKFAGPAQHTKITTQIFVRLYALRGLTTITEETVNASVSCSHCPCSVHIGFSLLYMSHELKMSKVPGLFSYRKLILTDFVLRMTRTCQRAVLFINPYTWNWCLVNACLGEHFHSYKAAVQPR